MKKCFLPIILFILILGMVTPVAAAEALPDLGGKEIKVAVENAYLPFNYIEIKTGKAGGLDYEVWDEICKRLNCKPKYMETSWESMIPAVQNKQFDAGADGISITEERKKVIDFSLGIISVDQRLLVRVDESRFKNVEEFKANDKLKLGTQTGTSNYETATKVLPESRIVAFEQFSFAVQALISKDVDAVLADETAGQGYMGENADKVKLVGEPLSSDKIGYIFPKDSDLVEPVNKALEAMIKDGVIEKLSAKYFSSDFKLTWDDIKPAPTAAP